MERKKKREEEGRLKNLNIFLVQRYLRYEDSNFRPFDREYMQIFTRLCSLWLEDLNI